MYLSNAFKMFWGKEKYYFLLEMEIEDEIRVNPILKSSNSNYRLSDCVELFQTF